MAEGKYISNPVPDKTCVVVGTRPGIIKMSPIISELEARAVDAFTLHAGQHYSFELDEKMFEDLRLGPPKHRVEGIDETEYHGEQTARMLEGIERILLEERPENVLVCADANFNLAGALAARKLRLNVGHVEAGLRSGDWRMPEEHNRVMIDHISDWLFVPTEGAQENARVDNVSGRIVLTGNTIVDAVYRNQEVATQESDVLQEIGVDPGKYLVFTAHREENVDDLETLSDLIEIIRRAASTTGRPVVYPIHPRTRKRINQFDLEGRLIGEEGVRLVDPLGYIDFLALLSSADSVLTDSGGIQEEACILQIPCITLRENTERPETVDVGANRIAGTDPSGVLEALETARATDRDWPNPFGDGKAAERVVDVALGSAAPDVSH